MQKLADFLRSTGRELGKSFRILWRNPSGRVGFVLLMLMVLISFVGPLVVPAPTQVNLKEIYQGPSLQHPLGTDYQGKDNLVLLVYGGKDILMVAFLAGLITTIIAVIIGASSAFIGGSFDSFMMEVVNIWLTIPQFPLLAVLATLVRLNSIGPLALIIGLLSWAGLARQIRSQVLSLKKRDFIEAAVNLNLSTRHILFRELLPNMMSFIAIALVFAMTSAIYQQTGLVFLGLVPLSGENWGVMLSMAYNKGAIYNPKAAWNVLAPVLAIVIFELSLVLIARSLDDVFNPRLRTEV
jgi:peptide/nickel transport system permease protein